MTDSLTIESPAPARGLAWIGQITELTPIANADRIELATVVCGAGGKWSGVVKKNDFAIGHSAIVYLQDAIVPQCPELSFLAASNWRVKMARFRGAPSECVTVKNDYESCVGADMTATLGVTKYEKPIPGALGGNPVGNFPSFIPKTDEPNFQTAYRLLDALRGQRWYATVKSDGSSTTAYRRGDHFGVCSRNLELFESPCAFWNVANKYNLRETLPDGIAIQFETVGPGIQKNPIELQAIDGVAFNAYHIDDKRYLNRNEFGKLCLNLQMPTAQIVDNGEEFNLDKTALQKLAEGKYPNGKNREGIVIRPYVEQWVGHDRLSFKVINLDYKD